MEVKKIATRDSFSDFLVNYGKSHKNLVVLNADLSTSTKTRAFEKAYPENFFNVGIAEQNMLGMACGMAHSGKTVIASSFIMFLTGRGYEMIRNSIAYTNANVKLCGTHFGLSVGADGSSHQALEDLALMSVIPGMVVVNPADDTSAKALLKQMVEKEGPAYIRLGRAADPVIYPEKQKFVLGKANKLREGKDATIIATGSMLWGALEAADKLAKQGINVRVLDMHTIKPLDKKAIIAAAKETKAIVTAEEHMLIGGLGSMVSSVVAENCPCKVKMVGVDDKFGESGTPEELYKKYKLTSNDIVKAVKAAIK